MLSRLLAIYYKLMNMYADVKHAEFCLNYDKAYEVYYNSEQYYMDNLNFQLLELLSSENIN